jgi:hypothetical protein
VVVIKNRAGIVTRGVLQDAIDETVRQIQSGEITLPDPTSSRPNLAGGTNHAPNSDNSYSTMAATVAGTTPATAGDANYEDYRYYRQQAGANLVIDSAHALKAVGHSLYAANEGTTHALPDWDRQNGWIEIGATGATQYDVALYLLSRIVSPGQRWYVRVRVGALNAAVVPAGVQLFAGLWEKRNDATEGYIQGGPFNISYEIEGAHGATSIDYRVLAKTDSGVEILSNVLNVPDAPNALSPANYVKLFFNAGPGFIEYAIYKKVAGVFSHVYSVRNTVDFQYNDTGQVAFPAEVVSAWPAAAANPQAYAETRDVLIGSFGGSWQPNDLTIDVPSTYDFSKTTDQFLRVGLTAPTAVDRHIGLDRIFLSTNYGEWAPDDASKYASGPSVSPTSSAQGSGSGVFDPPPGGSGGRTCVVVKTPILCVERGRNVFRRYQGVRMSVAELRGEERLPYRVLNKRQGFVSEYLIVRTRNGISVECSRDHEFALSVQPRRRVRAESLVAADKEKGVKGTRLACWVRGRKSATEVVSVKLVPRPACVGTFALRHTGGLHRDGDGMYVAGESERRDRGLFCFNAKLMGP